MIAFFLLLVIVAMVLGIVGLVVKGIGLPVRLRSHRALGRVSLLRLAG